MFTYFHCYHPETWDAQVAAGLVRSRDGIRFPESVDIEEGLKFNSLAAKGGKLYELVRDLGCGFYIDRMQGGCFLESYPYDMTLVREYRDMLGENFFGFQMHEWTSNFRSDLNKIARNGCAAWTKEEITAAIMREYPFPHVFVEAASAEEYEAFGCPGSWQDFVRTSEALFSRRQEYTSGDLLPCDSCYLPYPIELRAGAKRLMPEIGAQTADTRIQVAYARGMAKARGIPFGTYYEPWGGIPFSTCCYQEDGRNEWGLSSGGDFPFEPKGPNGGSSRSMQRRMHLYSYMAGASFMAEEWGMCNTFRDWKDFELTPYGEIKKEFLRFVERYGDIGTPVVPAAVVLPKGLPILDGVRTGDSFFLQPEEDTYLGFPVSGSFAETLRAVRLGLREIFCATGLMIGTETRSLLNCTVFDAVDIENEDFLDPRRNDVLVDLTGSGALSQRDPDKICAAGELSGRLDALLPCAVRGNAMKQLTRTDDGRYYLLLTNNSGVVRTVDRGDEFLAGAAETVSVETKNGLSLTGLEGAAVRLDDHGTYRVELPAGGYFFGRIA